MMKNKVLLIAVFTCLLVLAGCATAGSKGGEITGKVWALESLNGKPLEAGTGITAEFTADGKVSGSAGCNRYTGTYEVSGSKITFKAPMAATMMACPQPVMDQESAYFKALAAAASFSVDGDQLSLKDSGGTVVASYKEQTQDLSGSSWLVVNYNNGKQAVVSTLAGTELTANFAADGSISGSSGCNTYTGSYKVDGNKITISQVASTMMFCSEPEGVMDQEAQYLAALQTAATYQIEGDMLGLRTADDAMAANFSRK